MSRIIAFLSMLSVVMVLTCQVIYAQWSEPDTVLAGVASPFLGEDPVSPVLAAATDSTGVVHLVWSDSNNGHPDIFYSHQQGGSWTLPANISNETESSMFPSIAIGNDQAIHCAWTALGEDTTSVLYTYTTSPQDWASPIEISDSVLISAFPVLALDSQRNLHAMWNEIIIGQPFDKQLLAYKVRDVNAVWSQKLETPRVHADTSAFRPVISIDQNDILHCLWYDGPQAPNRIVNYSQHKGGGWTSTEQLAIGTISDDLPLSLSMRDDNILFGMWYNFLERISYYSVKVENQVWDNPINTNTVGFNHRLVVDEDGRLHAVWIDQGGVAYSYLIDLSGNMWSQPIRIATSNTIIHNFPELIIAKDNLHCFWVTTQAPYQIMHSYLNLNQIPSGLERQPVDLPRNYVLSQNHPNPFNHSTSIQFDIADQSTVTLKIFDILGREVATLVDEVLAPGSYTVTFTAQDVVDGVFFYRLQAGNFAQTKKLILVK